MIRAAIFAAFGMYSATLQVSTPVPKAASPACFAVTLPSGEVIDASTVEYVVGQRRVILTKCVLFADGFE